MQDPVVVVGAGVGGLSCAIALAARGIPVRVLEAANAPGGRLRVTWPGGSPVDSGPTVLTMASVFHELFALAGENLDDHLRLDPLPVLARHAWSDGSRLDLHADAAVSRDAILALSGASEARGFDRFRRDAQRLYQGLYGSFMRAQRPNVLELAWQLGARGAWQLRAGQPFATLWSTLGSYFRDPRLRQLFGRYATYVGSSPYAAPAVLMLIAQAEMNGVHTVRGGMAQLARALAALAGRHGAELCCGQPVRRLLVRDGRACGVETADGEQHRAAAVVFNGDPSALVLGTLGHEARASVPPPPRDPSLSALTYAWRARVEGFPLAHHTVFFSDDYAREFDELFTQRRLPRSPTVYLCAQDRGGLQRGAGADDTGSGTVTDAAGDGSRDADSERVFAIVNAPSLPLSEAAGTGAGSSAAELDEARAAAFALMQRCGLHLSVQAEVRTAPADFARLFPGTGGAIYGRACHGWRAPFERPAARTRLAGLYLAGGGAHPGPGLPMVAISGQLAAEALLADQGHQGQKRPALQPLSTLQGVR